jgi:sn-glycerol 3-phosphate transport system permease protein
MNSQAIERPLKNKQRIKWGNWVSVALLVLVSMIWLVPFIMTVLISLRPKDNPFGTGNPFFGDGLRLDSYVAAFDVVPWLQYYVNTFIFVFGVLAAQMVTITLAGYAFARLNFFGKNFLFIVLLIQLMIPSAVLLVPNLATVRGLNLYDTKWALMMPYIGSAFGVFLMRQTFRQVPRELEDAARIDGCNWLGLLRHVYVPSSLSAYVAFSLSSVSTHWNEFLWPFIVTNQEENRVLTTGLSKILRTSEVGAQYGQIAAATLIVIMPLLLFFLIFQRQFINSFLRSGLK